MEFKIASVRVAYDNGEYVTTVCWDSDFLAWKSMPGLNQYERVPQLDAGSPEGIAYFVSAILKHDPIGILEFLWQK